MLTLPLEAEQVRLRELAERVQSVRSGRGAGRGLSSLFDELMALTIRVAEASVREAADPEQARSLVRGAAVCQQELGDAVADLQAGRLSRVNQALAQLAHAQSTAALVQRAPVLLCEAGQFDRAMISRVRGSTWVPQVVHVAVGADDEVNAALVGAIGTVQISLTGSLVETEILRRRKSMFVDGSSAVRHTSEGLARLSRSRSYVGAPIVIGDRVVGFLHADTYTSRRLLTEVDRASIQSFADMFGLLYERAAAGERLREQQRAVATVLAEVTGDLEGEVHANPPRLDRRRPQSACATRPLARAGGLTEREWEILRELATGATNTQIAATLVVSESTVKSHVKRILHKLHAANRAEAVYRYTQLAERVSRVS